MQQNRSRQEVVRAALRQFKKETQSGWACKCGPLTVYEESKLFCRLILSHSKCGHNFSESYWLHKKLVLSCQGLFGVQGEGDNAFVGSNKLFPFSTVVFASWDYHLTDAGAARNLRHSIRNQLKEMVNDAMLEDKIVDTRTRVKGYISKVGSWQRCIAACC